MLDIHTVTSPAAADPLVNAEAAGRFWHSLPQDSPIAAQRKLCDALAQAGDWRNASLDRFRALRTLDLRVQGALEQTVAEYVALYRQPTELSRQLWQSAFELARSFAQGYEALLRFARETLPAAARAERVPEFLARLLRHREIELLLTLCNYDPWPRGRWKATNEAYAQALESDLARNQVTMHHLGDKTAVKVTPEAMYVRLLLLELVGSGQFLPNEIALARRVITRCAEPPVLVAAPPNVEAGDFVVDLVTAEGLKRNSGVSSPTLLWMNTQPLTDTIDGEIAAVRAAAQVKGARAMVVERRIAVLNRLRMVWITKPLHVKRRGERIPMTLTSVHATVGGLPSIFRMLRDAAQQSAAERANGPTPFTDEITITDVDAFRRTPVANARNVNDATSAFPDTMSFGVPQPTWQVRDRSESGCRLRGRVSNERRVIPGSLMAIRDDDVSPWTLVVVRRMKKLVGNNVELGVEYVGRNPQSVILVGDAGGAVASTARADRCAALYLPESAVQPRVPIRTLILPTCEFAHGRALTMLSTAREAQVRLRDALEHQADFVWASFDMVGTADFVGPVA